MKTNECTSVDFGKYTRYIKFGMLRNSKYYTDSVAHSVPKTRAKQRLDQLILNFGVK